MHSIEEGPEIIERLKRLERLFVEIVRGDCQEPDIIEMVRSHYHQKMGGTLSIDNGKPPHRIWNACWWPDEVVGPDEEPVQWAVAGEAIDAIRCVYEGWRESHALSKDGAD